MAVPTSYSSKTARQIDAEAAQWAARMDRGLLEPDQEKQFLAWLGEDVRCMGAYGRMRAIALSSERARALGPDFNPAALETRNGLRATFGSALPRRRMLQLGGAIAAA